MYEEGDQKGIIHLRASQEKKHLSIKWMTPHPRPDDVS